jgi:hypothetical protein
MDKILKGKAISLKVKLDVLRTIILSSMLHGREAWTIKKELERRILAFERTCYGKILRIGWLQRITREELYSRIQPKETLFQTAIQRKLTPFAYVCRMSDDGKIKALVSGIMDGSNKSGRTHTERVDNIVDWCKASLQELSHIAQD